MSSPFDKDHPLRNWPGSELLELGACRRLRVNRILEPAFDIRQQLHPRGLILKDLIINEAGSELDRGPVGLKDIGCLVSSIWSTGLRRFHKLSYREWRDTELQNN